MTDGAFFGVPKGKSGYYFYVEEEAGVRGPCLSGYYYFNGECRDLFGGGSASCSFVKELEEIQLRPFEFAQEAKRATKVLDDRARQEGRERPITMVMDGAEYEIEIHTAKGVFLYRAWNPGFEIDELSSASDDIGRLKKYIDTLARYLGRTKFSL